MAEVMLLLLLLLLPLLPLQPLSSHKQTHTLARSPFTRQTVCMDLPHNSPRHRSPSIVEASQCRRKGNVERMRKAVK